MLPGNSHNSASGDLVGSEEEKKSSFHYQVLLI